MTQIIETQQSLNPSIGKTEFVFNGRPHRYIDISENGKMRCQEVFGNLTIVQLPIGMMVTIYSRHERAIIELAVDHEEGAEFVQWLISRGHDASIGETTGNSVNGINTSSDEQTSAFLNGLWEEYCNA